MKTIQSAAVALLLLLSGNTFAAYTLYFFESGGNVVASGSGSMNLGALSPAGSGPLSPGVIASAGLVFTGTAGTVDAYLGISGPTADSFTVHIGIAPPASIPTLSEWGLLVLAVLMAGWAMHHRFWQRSRVG